MARFSRELANANLITTFHQTLHTRQKILKKLPEKSLQEELSKRTSAQFVSFFSFFVTLRKFDVKCYGNIFHLLAQFAIQLFVSFTGKSSKLYLRRRKVARKMQP